MDKREEQIIRLLLNEMAFEGAKKHFNITPPDLDKKLFDVIYQIGIPRKYDISNKRYGETNIQFDTKKSVFLNCYECLRRIRNNFIHANKAYRPDTPERLDELLSWSDSFIDSVYETESEFSEQANKIKQILCIRSF